MSHTDIAIIGGGLVGASLACALAPLIERHGLTVTIIEPAGLSAPTTPQPSFDDRSSAIAYGSARYFGALGLWPAMSERASPIRTIHISQRGYLGATRLSHRDVGTTALGYVLRNRWMGHVLQSHLAELPVQWLSPDSVETITAQSTGYRLTLASGKTLDTHLAVMADGGRSGLKQQLGIEDDVTPYHQHALISNVRLSRPHQGTAFERFTPEGPVALLPLDGREMALVWTHETEALTRAMSLSDTDFLSALQARFGDRAGRFEQVGKRISYPLSLKQAREQVRGHLAILGNAAHSLHPVAGQGFNLALRGVADLCAEIEATLNASEALGNHAMMTRFEARRARDRDQIVGFSDGLVRLFGVTNSLISHARGLGLIGLNVMTPARRALTRRAMGLER
ncbi:2-octaprenyl-6-methoxyphenyl hydroxylase [Larsenimonas salina]|uniref:2-octaprenyl-6-methoxyphenyl hydroxylase n=1 Tax=Larsenimonas salina TaxID=1295565 RepID=UPI0020741950|nr:2-octaprenyl-6-methoxyphenyl hydroxylase [Larsenimonas salina]MCM5704636.1 2-octaprenyl-6-methoxyphenyl hydroxylase [Larsenimonas salina]